MSDLHFNVCDETFARITEPNPDYHPLSEYSKAEQVVVAVWYASGVVQNSGFQGLFERNYPGDPTLELVSAAFSSLGSSKTTRAFFDAIDSIQMYGHVSADAEQRVDLWLKLNKENRDEIETRFYDGIDEMTLKLSDHISDSNLLPT